jgi:hypothetical protein
MMARGSQIRGKMIETYRSLFASHYKFERSAVKKIIAQNKAKAKKLLLNMSLHYKVFILLSVLPLTHPRQDPEARTGYAENTILPDVRRLTSFGKKDSVGALFPSYFDPISLELIALELCTVRATSYNYCRRC